MRSILYLPILVVLFCKISNSQTEKDSLTVRGIVIEYMSSEPLSGIGVIADGSGGTSSKLDGKFSFRVVRPKILRIRTAYPGFELFTAQIDITRDQDDIFLYLPIRTSGPENYWGLKAPSHWINIDANGRFSFCVPPNMKKNERYRGIDSYIGAYESADLLVSFSFDDYLTAISRDYPEYKERSAIIGCQFGTIFSFTSPTTTLNGFKYVLGARVGSGFTFQGEYNNESFRDSVMTILSSIQFGK